MKINKSVKIAFLIIGIAAPVFFYLFYMLKFGVDIPFMDEWDGIPLLKAYYNNESILPYLFAQHNELRPIFTRLIHLGVVLISDYNMKADLFVGWIFAILNLGVIWLILKQTKVEAKWILIPIAWIIFSISQQETILMDWARSFINLGISIAVYFLLKTPRSSWFVVPAIIGGLFATFSYINGLLAWPLGILLLWLMKHQKEFNEGPNKKSVNTRLMIIWAIIGVFIFIIYYTGYSRPSHHLPIEFSFHNPIKFAHYVLINLGASLGGGEVALSTMMGIFLLGIFIYLFFLSLKTNKESLYRLSPWFILGLFAFLSSCATAVGRSGGWTVDQALSSRYITASNLLIIANIVLTVSLLKEPLLTPVKEKILFAATSSLFIVIVIGIIPSMIWGWEMGRFTSSHKVPAIPYLKHFDAASDSMLKMLHPRPWIVREMAPFLREKRLSVFRELKEVDFNNCRELELPQGVFFGSIDSSQIIPSQAGEKQNDVVAIVGWAIDPGSKGLPKAVFIFCDGVPLGQAFLNSPRPDVAEALKDNRYTNSGWELVIRKNRITPGAHKIVARVVFAGTQFDSYKDLVRDVKIE